MFSEVPVGATVPPPWSPAATEARVTASELATAELYGRTMARWAQGTSVPGASTFIYAQSEVTPGSAPTSNVGIGAYIFAVFNPIGGDWKKTLEVINGNAMFSGGIQATTFIRLGSGVGWPIARGSVDFNLTDGEVCDFGTNLGSIPNLAFAMNNLAPLSTGETYNVYADPATLSATGFTLRAKISLPPTVANHSVTTDSTVLTIDTYAGESKPRGALPDTASGNYTLRAYGYQEHRVYGTNASGGGSVGVADNEDQQYTRLRVYAKKGGTWVFITDWYAYSVVDPDDFTVGFHNTYGYWDETLDVNIGTGATEIAVVRADSSNGRTGYLSSFASMNWQSAGTASGVRSATPSGQKTRITVRPQ